MAPIWHGGIAILSRSMATSVGGTDWGMGGVASTSTFVGGTHFDVRGWHRLGIASTSVFVRTFVGGTNGAWGGVASLSRSMGRSSGPCDRNWIQVPNGLGDAVRAEGNRIDGGLNLVGYRKNMWRISRNSSIAALGRAAKQVGFLTDRDTTVRRNSEGSLDFHRTGGIPEDQRLPLRTTYRAIHWAS